MTAFICAGMTAFTCAGMTRPSGDDLALRAVHCSLLSLYILLTSSAAAST
jgi:hypothetical protein